MRKIILNDNMKALSELPKEFVSLIYIDPPFNTGKVQKRDRIKTTYTDETGDRSGFGGRNYNVEKLNNDVCYQDSFEDFEGFLMSRIQASLHCLTKSGSLFVHLDYREVHYIKIALDRLLGRECFINEIIWAYDYGGRPKNRWPAKHDTILWYALNPNNYTFDFDAIDRIPYMAPGFKIFDRKVSRFESERGY